MLTLINKYIEKYRCFFLVKKRLNRQGVRVKDGLRDLQHVHKRKDVHNFQ